MIVITVSAEVDVTSISEDAPGALAEIFGKATSNMFNGKPVKLHVAVKVKEAEPEEAEPTAAIVTVEPKRRRRLRKTNG